MLCVLPKLKDGLGFLRAMVRCEERFCPANCLSINLIQQVSSRWVHQQCVLYSTSILWSLRVVASPRSMPSAGAAKRVSLRVAATFPNLGKTSSASPRGSSRLCAERSGGRPGCARPAHRKHHRRNEAHIISDSQHAHRAQVSKHVGDTPSPTLQRQRSEPERSQCR